ncbi:MAG: YlxM family DNA-binding protein [Lachnospiraceae bacterium]|nr:YlxM family DNA-binding protein [Lachnospiraceae bacterium]
MDKIVEQGLLYDFYGELLTEHQRQIYEDAFWNDLSLSEIAAERGISRQGVHDLLRRCNKLLAGYESKLHLVEKFEKTKASVQELSKEIAALEGTGGGGEHISNLKKRVNEILEEL